MSIDQIENITAKSANESDAQAFHASVWAMAIASDMEDESE